MNNLLAKIPEGKEFLQGDNLPKQETKEKRKKNSKMQCNQPHLALSSEKINTKINEMKLNQILNEMKSNQIK